MAGDEGCALRAIWSLSEQLCSASFILLDFFIPSPASRLLCNWEFIAAALLSWLVWETTLCT